MDEEELGTGARALIAEALRQLKDYQRLSEAGALFPLYMKMDGDPVPQGWIWDGDLIAWVQPFAHRRLIAERDKRHEINS